MSKERHNAKEKGFIPDQSFEAFTDTPHNRGITAMTTLAQNVTFEQTTIVAFNGASLVTAKIKEVIYVAMRPIVEAMGLDWAGQTVKLNHNKEKFNCCDIATVAEDGKNRSMLFIPLRKLNGWLFSINPSKVREDLRERVVQYQEECFEVLYRYWQGEAVQRPYQMPLPTMSDKRTRVPLKDAVTLLVAKSRNMNYSEAYGMIHQRFDVDSVENLTTEQVPLAVEYIHRVVCEFIGKDALPAPKPLLDINYPAITARPPKSFNANQHWFKADDFVDGNFDPVRDFLIGLETAGYEVTGLQIINQAKTWVIQQQAKAIKQIDKGYQYIADGLKLNNDYGMNVSGFVASKVSM